MGVRSPRSLDSTRLACMIKTFHLCDDRASERASQALETQLLLSAPTSMMMLLLLCLRRRGLRSIVHANWLFRAPVFRPGGKTSSLHGPFVRRAMREPAAGEIAAKMPESTGLARFALFVPHRDSKMQEAPFCASSVVVALGHREPRLIAWRKVHCVRKFASHHGAVPMCHAGVGHFVFRAGTGREGGAN